MYQHLLNLAKLNEPVFSNDHGVTKACSNKEPFTEHRLHILQVTFKL